jgi:hypothetical protein
MAEGWVTDSGSLLPGVNAQGTDSGHATKVVTSKQAATTILFCKTGQTTIRQLEEETVTEYRGLDETSATAKVGVTDGTTQTAYYATFNGDDHSITVTTGSKKEVSARRTNEANGWVLTVRNVTYSVLGLDTNKWKTTRVVSGGGDARTVSVNMSSSHVRTWAGVSLYSTKRVTVREHPGLSQAAAESLAESLSNETNVAEHVMVCNVSSTIDGSAVPGSWCYASLHTGKVVYTSTKKVSDDEGYTVTETEEVYSWRQAGNGTSTSSSGGHNYSTTKAWSVYS